ncbi:MAG: recombinase family protein [Planctomycetota bacterium]
MQRAELRDYVSRRGWTAHGEYVDHGMSGTKHSRPELDTKLQRVHAFHPLAGGPHGT